MAAAPDVFSSAFRPPPSAFPPLHLHPADDQRGEHAAGGEFEGGLEGDRVEIDFGAVEVGELHSCWGKLASPVPGRESVCFYKISASSGNPESCRIESSRRRMPRAEVG